MIFYDRYENYFMAVFPFAAILYPFATDFRYRINKITFNDEAEKWDWMAESGLCTEGLKIMVGGD
jgi:hypothetical protein